MRRVISSFVVAVLLGGFTGATAQLPPGIMADAYLLQAEQLIAEQDYGGALDALNEIVALQREHNFTLPDVFHFKYAQVALGAGSSEEALESVTKYLATAGRDGEFYREALELMNKAQAEIEEQKEQGAREARDAEARDARELADREIRAALERDLLSAIEFVRIPAGEFWMGSISAVAHDWEQPVTQVRISRAFDLGKYEVTQGHWEVVIGNNPSYFQECGLACPVEQVSWEEAQEFIRRLNAMDGAGTYRLPTEAEWEYAARAGTTGDRYAANLDAIAWCRENSGGRTHPVGGKAPNAFGLYDMLGNVTEWVLDDYWLPGGAVTDPVGRVSDLGGSLRGGSWANSIDSVRECRASYRNGTPGASGADMGFRLLRTVP